MAACAVCLLQGCAASFSGPACTPQPLPAPSRCRQCTFYVPAQGLLAMLRLPSWVFGTRRVIADADALVWWSLFGDTPRHLNSLSLYAARLPSVEPLHRAFVTCGQQVHLCYLRHASVKRLSWTIYMQTTCFGSALANPPMSCSRGLSRHIKAAVDTCCSPLYTILHDGESFLHPAIPRTLSEVQPVPSSYSHESLDSTLGRMDDFCDK